MQQRSRDKLWSACAAAIVVALLGYALLLGLTVELGRAREQAPMAVLDIRIPPPPPPQHPPHRIKPRRGRSPHRPSPPNLKAKSTEILRPPPVLPVPSPVITAPKVGPGMAPSAGASDRPGPGFGAGGQGEGAGGGGDEGGDTPPRLIHGRLHFSDLPNDLRDGTVSGTVSVEYDVDVDGRARNCAVTRSSGNAELDQATCRLIEERFRFDPSRDAEGRPVPSSIVENHSWIVDRTPGPGNRP
ncbi:MAG TPA: TonB family protein [Sphingomonas sp.]|nr:TonB family protein [Sphingomonas sp.]